MDRGDQKRIIREVCDGIKATATYAIDDGKIPEEWDGIELRQLVFEMARAMRADQKRFNKRLRDFQEFMLINPEIL